MTLPSSDPVGELSGDPRSSWNRYLAAIEPLRPELYRYCRHLTPGPWDAEDLVQDALARAFVTLGQLGQELANPRAWLFRVASNLWLDRAPRRREVPDAVAERAAREAPVDAREAAGALIARLSPQERAAVVLKDVFDFSLAEIAETLTTSPGAVKAALHRGRGKLEEPEPAPARTAAPAVLDAFCAAFNAGDLERLVALLLDTSIVDVVGVHTDYGPEAARRAAFQGMLFGAPRISGHDPRGGVEPRFRQGILPARPRVEVRVHRGEPILLHWYAHADGEAVRAFTRVEAEGERLARVKNYFFTPDAIAEVCRELGVPFRGNGYRATAAT